MKQTLAILALSATLSAVAQQVRSDHPAINAQQQEKREDVPFLSIEEQEDAPLCLLRSSTRAVPEHPEMVDVDFVLKNRSAKPLRAYTLHCEEVWEDAQVGNGTARQDRRFPVTEASGDELQASFRVRAKAKLKCQIASVDFEDETGWKPNMSRPEEREKPE